MARTMAVDFGDELRAFICSPIKSDNYITQSEVIRESLRLLRENQARGLPLKTVKLTSKATQDLEDIWFYGYHHFGEVQADKYINALPFELHIIFFLLTDTDIIIRLLNQH